MANATLSSLFGSELLLHYDASDASSLFEDAAGTDAAEDGDAILCWKPQSDAALSVNVTETTNGPTYHADYAASGYAGLEFDGTNDRLSQTTTGLSTTDPFYTISVYQPISASVAATIWQRGPISDLHRVYHSPISTCTFQFGVSSSYTVRTFVSGTAKQCISTHSRNGYQSHDGLGYCNGGRTATAIGAIGQSLFLGAGDSSGWYQGGNIVLHEFVLLGAGCEWGQVIRASTLLRDKWGITDPNAIPQLSGGLLRHPGMTGGISA